MTTNIKKKSELELVFERINQNRIKDLKKKCSPKSPKVTPKKSKSQKMTPRNSSKNISPSNVKSINEILKCNNRNSSVKKKETSKVKMLIRELENPKIRSPLKPKGRISQRKAKLKEIQDNGALSNQAQITNFFGKLEMRRSTDYDD